MKKSLILTATSIVMFWLGSPMAISQLTIECTSPTTPEGPLGQFIVEPNTPGETARMLQAPHGAHRSGKHVLIVHWQRDSREFKDKAPYMNGTMDGLYWTYCGFSPQTGVHVIQKNGPDWLTGILVNEKDGAILPGGFSVSFSPDLQKYFAREQEDGADLETIRVFSRNGRLLWSGLAGLFSPDGTSEISEFENIHWGRAGELVAISKDYESGQRKTLVLRKTANGNWQWSPISVK
jgi:hypothetical protein